LMMEVLEEVNYVNHHKKKIVLLFSAMRHFAKELRRKNSLSYIKIDDKKNTGSFSSEINRMIEKISPKNIMITEPGEYRVLKEIEKIKSKHKIPFEIIEDDRFFCSINEFKDWSKSHKQFRMEDFYRKMRKDTGILIKNGAPIGGKWNYDALNRNPLKEKIQIKENLRHKPDSITVNVIKTIKKKFQAHFGSVKDFWYGVDHKQAEKSLDYFIKYNLEKFGDFQDAMKAEDGFLFHSIISPYMNCGLLDPKYVVKRIVDEYEKGKIPINSAEGFIRQVLGWREFVRGIYWLNMPNYSKTNYFRSKKNLPKFFWTGKTELYCMQKCVEQIIKDGYAHHIQRLMVLGNFALLSGIIPKQVCEWYLSVFVDAYDWVELPNTHGMALFADGGIIASKPYASSGNYINKMSDYCKSCKYNVKIKNGEKACPFNYLYWNFLITNKEKLKNNSRLWMQYNTLSKMPENRRKEIIKDSKNFLSKI